MENKALFWSKNENSNKEVSRLFATLAHIFVLYFGHFYRDEAEMEYLKIAQDLEMYGVNYFEIKVS